MTQWMSKLCTHVGVHDQYRGFEGQTVKVSPDTQRAVLKAMGLDASSDEDARLLLEQMQADAAARPLPPEVIIEAGSPSEFDLAHRAEWTLEAERTGEILCTGSGDATLSLPSLPMGIHRLVMFVKGQDHITWVLARPARAVQLEDHFSMARIWGVLAALYGLTDGDRAQIGSYELLGSYAAEIARHGADFLGINPVHAMGQTRPDDVISPYSPSHRAFLNTWHCGDGSGPSGNQDELVDYPKALRGNAQALSDQFAAFCLGPVDTPEKRAFDAFVKDAGEPLHQFALYEALAARHGPDWREWPTLYRDHDAVALADVETRQTQDIARTKWAQWRAEVQLGAAQAKACTSGMRVGLYLDLAVGPRLGGAETWDRNTSLVTGATLGAPPDPLGPLGQSWGLAPLSPLKCRAEGYAGFARLLRSIMRHAGMIRIDHVLGLMRSFWIPDGGTEGTYVSYPLEALLAIVAIESQRNNTIVVGEDLGLVPNGLRKELAKSGIYGLDVLQYMRTEAGGFVDTTQTRKLAVCSFATHDTPTISGFFSSQDAQVRHDLGGLDTETLKNTQKDRGRALKSLKTSDPVVEVHRRLARANANMVAIQLDDIAGRTSQQNLPGTVDSYPNWRLKTPFSVEEISTSKPLSKLARDMAAQDRTNLKVTETEDDLSDCSNHAH